MNRKDVSRRALLQGVVGGAGVAVVLAASKSYAADAKVCVDLANPASNKGLRDALRFTEKAADPKKSCGTCGFFIPGSAPPCGECKIFSGPTNVNGFCESWAAKS